MRSIQKNKNVVRTKTKSQQTAGWLIWHCQL